jgi:zona occludens toxin
VKRSIPIKLILAMLFIVSVMVAGYFGLDAYQNRGKVAKIEVPNAPGQTSAKVSGFGGPAAGGDPAKLPFDPIADARRWTEQATPRLVGLPQTAPKYDELTKPTRVPIPAACIQHHGDKCKCFTQQGTSMDVAFNMCVEFARNGFFQEFDADKDRVATAVQANSAQLMASSSLGTRQEPSQVVSITDPTVLASVGSSSSGGASAGRGKALPPPSPL